MAWCVIFVWWLFRDTGLLLKTASSTTLYNWFKGKKQIFPKPKVGDVVFFNFDKNPKPGECKHTGYVVQIVDAKRFRTIEGNTSFEKETDGSPAKESNGGAVALRTRSLDSSVIGFGRPNYESTEQKPQILLKKGSKGKEVQQVHQVLRRKGYGVDPTNTVYDDLTERCVKHFQASNGIEADGIVGPVTASLLYN